MADMPSYTPDAPPDVAGDDGFADAVAGNIPEGKRGGAGIDRVGNTRNALFGVAQSQLFGLAEVGKRELVDNIATIAGIVREVATQVETIGVEPFAGYAVKAADLVDDLHGSFRDKSIEDLIDDGRDLVRQQPEIAIAAAVIAGFIGVRIFKARN